jgi:hypothetical protein
VNPIALSEGMPSRTTLTAALVVRLGGVGACTTRRPSLIE